MVKPEIYNFPDFYPAAESEQIFRHFLQHHQWPNNRYNYAGRQFVLPRLQTWHADDGIRYSYSNNLLETRPWTPLLQEIRYKVEAFLATRFNAVLANCYRDGSDHVGWHADDEEELGTQPLIASLSFGAERRFEFKHKHLPDRGYLSLASGCLLLMHPSFQHQWLHRIPMAHDVANGRINLTFRRVMMKNTPPTEDA